MKKSLLSIAVLSAIVLLLCASCGSHSANRADFDADSIKKVDTVKRAVPAPVHTDSVTKQTAISFNPRSIEVTTPVDNLKDSVGIAEGVTAPAKTFSAKVFFADSLQKGHTIELNGFDYLDAENRKDDNTSRSDHYSTIKAAFAKITKANVADLVVKIDSSYSYSPRVTIMEKIKPVVTGKKIGNATVRDEMKMEVIYQSY